MKKILIVLLGLIFIAGCQQATNEASEKKDVSSPTNEFIGTWGLDEWSYSDADTSWHRTDLYGQAIFTESYYSVIYLGKDGLREDLLKDKEWEDITVDDLRYTIGMVTANSGRYEIEGDSMVFYRDVALYPGAMEKDNQPMKISIGYIENNIWIREGDGWSVKWKRLE